MAPAKKPVFRKPVTDPVKLRRKKQLEAAASRSYDERRKVQAKGYKEEIISLINEIRELELLEKKLQESVNNSLVVVNNPNCGTEFAVGVVADFHEPIVPSESTSPAYNSVLHIPLTVSQHEEPSATDSILRIIKPVAFYPKPHARPSNNSL